MMTPYVLVGSISDQVTLIDLGNLAAAVTDVGGAPGTETRIRRLSLKDKPEVSLINATKQTYQLLMQILTFVSNINIFIKRYDNLGPVWSQCRHFLA